jgi:CRISPR-associated protein Csb2
MPAALVLTVRFLNPVPTFHGRADEGEPEWPPSPLRVFQALVAAAAARWKAASFRDYAEPALHWLERQPQPEIVAPDAAPGHPFRRAVPNNDMDKVARAWSGGNYSNSGDANPATHRSLKTIRPTRLLGGNAVHYVYVLADAEPEFERVRESLFAATRGVTHVGWGVDVATMDAKVVTGEPATGGSAHHWRPAPTGGVPLRVPDVGTLDALTGRYNEFLARAARTGVVDSGTPFTAYRVVGYHSPTVPSAALADPAGRPWAAFRITSVDPDDPNPAFDTPRRCRDVAAWVRNAVARVCAESGWSFVSTPVAEFVHGHGPDGKQLTGPAADRRFMYLPLPTINPALNRVESIRRVLVAAPLGFEGQLDWVRRRLPGQGLVDLNGQPVGLLTEHTGKRWVLDQYTMESRVWSTVTPVVLPGYDDPDHLRRRLREKPDTETQKRLLAQIDRRVEGLIRKALRQAGVADELAESAELEWRPGGFRPGVELAHRYARPERLEAFSAYHVRVRFLAPLRGPLAIGAGRYRGLGLFATESAD